MSATNTFNPDKPFIRIRVNGTNLKRRILRVAERKSIDAADVCREALTADVDAEETRLGLVPLQPFPSEQKRKHRTPEVALLAAAQPEEETEPAPTEISPAER